MIPLTDFARLRCSLAAIVVGVFGLSPGQAAATAVFSSSVNLTATLSLGNGAALSGLGFASGSNFYNAGVEVGVPGGFHSNSATQSVDNQPVPPIRYDLVAQSGGIAPLIFSDDKHSMKYPGASASATNGVAHASGSPSGSGTSFTMTSSIDGAAYPQRGHAAANVAWEATTFFTNLTSSALTVIWTVDYKLFASAHVDDPLRERAITETHLYAGFGVPPVIPKDFAFIAAADPPLDPPVSDIPIRPSPPPIANTKTYQLILAPGATDKFAVAISQFGVADVFPAPLPPTLWLSIAALAALAVATRHRAT